MQIREQEIETKDGRVVYLEAGDGPQPVVMIHGWTRSPRVWINTLEATPPGFRAIAYDQVLRSEPPRGGYNLPALANRTAAIMDALGIERAMIAGHSMGGTVALEFALRYPERVERLVLMCTGPNTPPITHTGGGMAVRLLREQGKTPEVMTRILNGWFHQPPSDAEMGPMLEDAMLWPEEALFGIRASQEATDYRPRLHEISAPTLIVHGEHDHGRPIEQAQVMAESVQNGKLVTIPGCGHTPTQEAPEAFNQVFWTFLGAK